VDRPTRAVDGDEGRAVLGLEHGPDVGRALAFLRERAFQEGPPSRTEAVEALQRGRATAYCAGP